MRALILIVLCAFISGVSYTQVNKEITERRNVYNTKGDYYFGRNEFKKAIVYYNLAYHNDTSDYFSVLKKAEAYARLKLYPQAELCYRIVFDKKLLVNNMYRLKYALVLYANNKTDAFKYWIDEYSQVVNNEIEGENYLISTENRVKLYKDTAIVLAAGSPEPDTIAFKIRYAGYQYKRRSSDDDNKIYLVLSNGDEHAIEASATSDFKFSFQPMDEYYLIVEKANIEAENILIDSRLTPAQLKQNFLDPPPVQKDVLKLQKAMKYQFSSGKYKITPEYINSIKSLAGEYQSSGESAVDLTALVKELQLDEDAVFMIRFTRETIAGEASKKLEVSAITMNEKTVNIFGQSFLLLLPDRANENFAIQTDIEELEKTFSPRKFGLVVDDSPMFKAENDQTKKGLLSLTINTPVSSLVPAENRFTASEISIIPGTEYILSLGKPDPKTGKDIEVIVPLTRGVKYNLTSLQPSDTGYKKALGQFLESRSQEIKEDEEVIDISILSKELEVKPGEELTFNLLPAKKFGKQPLAREESASRLSMDNKILEIGRNEMYSINVPFNLKGKVHFQTDLAYVQENFTDGAYTLRLDTISFTSEIAVDTAGYGKHASAGWLSMSINTESVEDEEIKDWFTANHVSIIPGKEYILTVSKIDAVTGKEEEIIVPLLRQVKYDFTSNPESEEAYKVSLREFIEGREDIETIDGTVIDITLLSKELQIAEGDQVSFSLLPVRKLPGKTSTEGQTKSSLFLDKKVVEFTQIQKYTINMPLSDGGQVNMQTNIEHLLENFEPGAISVDVDTASFFSEITIDTSGLGYRAIKEEEEIKDPVFDVVTVNFDLNQHTLQAESTKTIREDVIDELKSDGRLYVTIKGYTDALGNAEYNYNLSKRRAESVKDYLISNGISESRIRTFSFGASQSLDEGIDWNDLSEAELRKHRKVEIVIYLPE
jgi:outer membrane protein OmpA-like peptidoglycan-associated protein